MKKTLLFAALALIVAASCTKTKTNTVTVTTHDTINVPVYVHDTTNIAPTLYGHWTDGSANIPTFTADSMQWTGQPAFRYAASSDSIYVLGTNHVIYTAWSYRISINNDSLWLSSATIPGGGPIKVYTRP